MISDLSAANQNFLAGLDQIQQKLQTSETQLTTGLLINNDSDDPGEISDLWQSRSELSQANQIDSNLSQVSTEVNTAQSALEGAVTLVERAETLGTQGASDTTDATTREDLAGELGSILQQLVATANTSVQNRYIFSGDADQTAPYSINVTNNPPVVSAYQGAASTRQVQSPDGTTFSVALTAQQIFDSPSASTNIFSSVTDLIQGLLNNDDTAINSSVADIQDSDTYLNQQLAYYGTVSDRITDAQTFGQNYTTQLQTQISGIEDANAASAITDMTQAQTQLQAALQSQANLPKSTLFDFMG
jgi:flagellar hook-associated protein 3 FlgL